MSVEPNADLLAHCKSIGAAKAQLLGRPEMADQLAMQELRSRTEPPPRTLYARVADLEAAVAAIAHRLL